MSKETQIFIPVLNPEMEVDIKEFYEQEDVQALKAETKGFVGACKTVSYILSHGTGLHLEDGTFRVDTPSFGFLEYSHYWCRDGLGRIIDLTAIQFNKKMEKPIPDGVLIINPDDSFYQRYTLLERTTSIEEELADLAIPKRVQ